MAPAAPDPYLILGVSPEASDDAVRTAYRRLVQRHHPDHNGGSRESALRFAQVQEAYAHVRLVRKRAEAGDHAAPDTAAGPAPADDELSRRLAAMEQELRTARQQREHAARAAGRAAAAAAARERFGRSGDRTADRDRPSDEELGFVTTDDSFAKIFDDLADQVTRGVGEAREAAERRSGHGRGASRSFSELIDELGSRLTGDHGRREDRGDQSKDK